jgi:hypothetical protein
MAFKIIKKNEFNLNSFSYAIDKLIEDYFYGNTDTDKFESIKNNRSAYEKLKNLQYNTEIQKQ